MITIIKCLHHQAHQCAFSDGAFSHVIRFFPKTSCFKCGEQVTSKLTVKRITSVPNEVARNGLTVYAVPSCREMSDDFITVM